MRARSAAALAAARHRARRRPGRRTRRSPTRRATPDRLRVRRSSRPARPHRRRPGHGRRCSAKRVRGREQPDARRAVVALAGGPGQAALPARDRVRRDPRPRARRRATCSSSTSAAPAARARCAARRFERGIASIADGARRRARTSSARRARFFRTLDSVADIEALRVEAGYEKLVLYGVSYGTKVALDYAAAYPARVEALVLDSVVPPEGRTSLQRSTFAAIAARARRAVRGGACAGITTNVGRDLATLVPRPGARRSRGHGRHARRAPPHGDARPGRRCSTSCSPATSTRRCAPSCPGACAARSATTTGRSCACVLRGQGLTGIPRPARRARSTSRLRRAVRHHALRGVRPSRGTARRGPEQRAGQAVAAASARPATDFGPVQLQGRAAQRARSRCASAGPIAARRRRRPTRCRRCPTLILAGGADLRTPLEDARGRRRADPGRAARRACPHRATRCSAATSRPLRQERGRRVLRAASRSRSAPAATHVVRALAGRADAPAPRAAGARKALQDGRRRAGDRARRPPAVPRRRDRRRARDAARAPSAACAAGTRRATSRGYHPARRRVRARRRVSGCVPAAAAAPRR